MHCVHGDNFISKTGITAKTKKDKLPHSFNAGNSATVYRFCKPIAVSL